MLLTRKKLGIEDSFVFEYIGKNSPWQGVENLVEAAKLSQNDSTTSLFVGFGKKKRERNILFLPEVQHKEVPYYYSMCDVLILPRPSHVATEIAAPTKFAEYAAMGKPILLTNVGDAAQFI